MSNIKITLTTNEAQELIKLLEILTFDDVATLLERSEGKTPEVAEEAYDVWNVTDNLHRTLLDRGINTPVRSPVPINSPKRA